MSDPLLVAMIGSSSGLTAVIAGALLSSAFADRR